MTNTVTSAPTLISRLRLPHLGTADTFNALISLIGEAYCLAYAAPLTGYRPRWPGFVDEQFQDKDPSR